MTAPLYVRAWREALPSMRVDHSASVPGVRFAGLRGRVRLCLDSDGQRPHPEWTVHFEIGAPTPITAIASAAAPTLADRVLTGDDEFDAVVALFCADEWEVLMGLTEAARLALGSLLRAGATMRGAVISLSPRVVASVTRAEDATGLLQLAETALTQIYPGVASSRVDRMLARCQVERDPGVKARLNAALDRASANDPRIASTITLGRLMQQVSAGGDPRELLAGRYGALSRRDLIEFIHHRTSQAAGPPGWGVAFLLDLFTVREVADVAGIWVGLGLAEADLDAQQWSKLVAALRYTTALRHVGPLVSIALKRAFGEAIANAVEFAASWSDDFSALAVMRDNPRPGLAPFVVDECADAIQFHHLRDEALSLVARYGDSRCEPALLRLLDYPEAAMKVRVLGILGALGGQRSLTPIEAMTSGLFRADEVKSAARDAIRQLRERDVCSMVGGLSVSAARAPGAGALTDADRGSARGAGEA